LYWKLPKIIKNEDELRDVENILKKEWTYLKGVYHSLTSASTYPGLANDDWVKFTEVLGITDPKCD